MRAETPLEPPRNYRDAVNDFKASGRDEYKTLPGKPQQDTAAQARDIAQAWLEDNWGFTALDPAIEKRITAPGTARL